MKNYKKLLLGLIYLISISFYAQEKGGTVHIPSTISQGAKDVLKGWTIQGRNDGAHLPKGDAPVAEWVKKQDEFQEMAAKSMPDLLKKYQPTVDTIFIEGIRAIDVKPKNYKKSNKVIIYIHGGAYTFLRQMLRYYPVFRLQIRVA